MSHNPIEGDHVHFIDQEGYIRNALVTAVWSPGEDRMASINLVVVHKDKSRMDTYGRQIDRNSTSVPHKTQQAAPGYYWKWLDE